MTEFSGGFLRLQEFITKLQKLVEKFRKIAGSSGKFEEKIAGISCSYRRSGDPLYDGLLYFK
jgi:hypothetical protein